jgi:hypothetical protein
MTPQKYFLCSHAYQCGIDDGVVFLDLRTEKYIGLGKVEAEDLGLLVHGLRPEAGSSHEPAIISERARALAEVLVARGLLTKDAACGKAAASIRSQRLRAIEFAEELDSRPELNFSHLRKFLWACLQAARKMKLHSLERMVRDAAARKESHAHDVHVRSEAEMRRLVSIFRWLRPLVFTAKEACLFDSLALLEFLYQYRAFPTWYFGVYTRPFRAHSWLQHDGLVLNGSLELTRLYTPLLAI